jgi:polyhydroxyalkanoate synthesis regulator phasin
MTLRLADPAVAILAPSAAAGAWCSSLSLALGLLATAPANAADWVRVAAGGTDQHFYDRSKLSIRGDEIGYWRKVVFARPVKTRSGLAHLALHQERINCRDHTLRGLAWQLHAEEGAMLDSATQSDAEAVAIVPETIGDRFQAVMCELVAQRRQKDADLARDEATLAARRKELEALKADIERLEGQIQSLQSERAAAQPPAETIVK